MVYVVFVAICLSATPAKDCRQSTALDWIVAPETPASLSACMRHGLQYAAASRRVTAGSYAKVFCAPKPATGKTRAQRIGPPHLVRGAAVSDGAAIVTDSSLAPDLDTRNVHRDGQRPRARL